MTNCAAVVCRWRKRTQREKYYIRNGSGIGVEEGRDRQRKETEMKLISKEREVQR